MGRIQCTLKAIQRQRKPATVNRQRAALAAVFKYAIGRRYIYKNPVYEIPLLPEDNKRVRYLSDVERVALLEACHNSDWGKLHLLVLMAICTGARKTELLNLRWSDIHFKRGIASVRITKNGEPRELPLPAVVIQELGRHRRVGNGLVFNSTIRIGQPFEYKKHWVAALKAAGLQHPVGHSKYFRFFMICDTRLQVTWFRMGLHSMRPVRCWVINRSKPRSDMLIWILIESRKL